LTGPDGPFEELADTAARWERQLHAKAAAMRVPEEIADRAQQWVGELAGDQPRRLLHGDFHPGDVLAAQRRSWLAIDPKPWVGDPAFDLAQVLLNWTFVQLDTRRGPVDAMRFRAADWRTDWHSTPTGSCGGRRSGRSAGASGATRR
jgi:streptomycin 6-kinase